MEPDCQQKNYYELLGVARTASRKEIKLAYRELALVYHPDSHFFDEIISAGLRDSQSQMFKLATAAYHTLINAEARAEYDRSLPAELPGWNLGAARTWVDPKVEEAIAQRSQRRTAASYGVFGRMERPPPSAFDTGSDMRLRSVAELCRPSATRRAIRALGDMAAVLWGVAARALGPVLRYFEGLRDAIWG